MVLHSGGSHKDVRAQWVQPFAMQIAAQRLAAGNLKEMIGIHAKAQCVVGLRCGYGRGLLLQRLPYRRALRRVAVSGEGERRGERLYRRRVPRGVVPPR